METETTTIKINKNIKNQLDELKTTNESYNTLINNLIKENQEQKQQITELKTDKEQLFNILNEFKDVQKDYKYKQEYNKETNIIIREIERNINNNNVLKEILIKKNIDKDEPENINYDFMVYFENGELMDGVPVIEPDAVESTPNKEILNEVLTHLLTNGYNIEFEIEYY